MNYLSMNDFSFGAKNVLVRVDVNSPVADVKVVENGAEIVKKTVQINDRILSAADTILELSERGAKIVVLAHQGRPGDKDYTELDLHASLITKNTGLPIKYVDDIYGEKAIDAIKALNSGEVLMLKNVRSLKAEMAKLSPEEHAKSDFVIALEPLFDYFVNDAFSVSHRSQCSVVGFRNIPNLAGLNMEKEINGLNRIENMERPCVFVFGGAKPDDVFLLLKKAVERGNVDKFLTSGFIGQNVLIAKGVNLGKQTDFLKEKGCIVEGLSDVVNKAGDKIEAPIDFAIDVNGVRKEILVSQLPSDLSIQDIGELTARRYADIIKSAKTVYVKGPAGVIENPEFRKGTEIILRAVVESNAFSIMGGGHSLEALDMLNIDKSKIGYISLAGGALVEFIAGEQLPGLKSLEYSYEKFKQ